MTRAYAPRLVTQVAISCDLVRFQALNDSQDMGAFDGVMRPCSGWSAQSCVVCCLQVRPTPYASVSRACCWQ